MKSVSIEIYARDVDQHLHQLLVFCLERIFHGKDYALCFSQIIIIFYFISVFVSLGLPSSGNLFFSLFSLHLKVTYTASNFIFLLQT